MCQILKYTIDHAQCSYMVLVHRETVRFPFIYIYLYKVARLLQLYIFDLRALSCTCKGAGDTLGCVKNIREPLLTHMFYYCLGQK